MFSFKEQLWQVRDSLRKQKEAYASTHAELELWNAQVVELRLTVGDHGGEADVGP